MRCDWKRLRAETKALEQVEESLKSDEGQEAQ